MTEIITRTFTPDILVYLLKGAGVDMTTAAPVEEALALFDELLDEMEELLEA